MDEHPTAMKIYTKSTLHDTAITEKTGFRKNHFCLDPSYRSISTDLLWSQNRQNGGRF